MKNPMASEEMAQAVLDNGTGHDMQWHYIGETEWKDRQPAMAGKPLDFSNHEYRRKPEPIERYVNVHKEGKQIIWKQYRYAKYQADCNENIVRTVRLVEDPTWVEPEPKSDDCKINTLLSRVCERGTKSCEIVHNKSEEKNPWRPIVQGEWPECKPNMKIVCRDNDGHTWENFAGNQGWNNPLAVEWKYAEDE